MASGGKLAKCNSKVIMAKLILTWTCKTLVLLLLLDNIVCMTLCCAHMYTFRREQNEWLSFKHGTYMRRVKLIKSDCSIEKQNLNLNNNWSYNCRRTMTVEY